MAKLECRATVYIATSKDGYIADKDGSVEWLNNCVPKLSEGEDCGKSLEDLLSSVDAIVMGRKTFESVIKLCQPIGPHPWPYRKTPLLVLTNNKEFKVPESLDTVSLGSGDPAAVMADLALRHGAKFSELPSLIDIYIFLYIWRRTFT
mmetsp:Transcript_8399/g.9882  ORF Transcript_8399/g.9882 Transcript_8399/m.9882 type:complete len:148 (+) Transcript_8399:106-549(+)